jgi:hypothetical protein
MVHTCRLELRWGMSASLIGRLGSSTFRLSTKNLQYDPLDFIFTEGTGQLAGTPARSRRPKWSPPSALHLKRSATAPVRGRWSPLLPSPPLCLCSPWVWAQVCPDQTRLSGCRRPTRGRPYRELKSKTAGGSGGCSAAFPDCMDFSGRGTNGAIYEGRRTVFVRLALTEAHALMALPI